MKLIAIATLILSMNVFAGGFESYSSCNPIILNPILGSFEQVSVHLSKRAPVGLGDFNALTLDKDRNVIKLNDFKAELLHATLVDSFVRTSHGTKVLNQDVKVFAVKVELSADEVLGIEFSGFNPGPVNKLARYVICEEVITKAFPF